MSSSDVNGNSLLRPNNLDYDSDNKENSILNHPNVVRSIQSQASKQSRKTHEDDMESSKGQSKVKSSNFMQISQFLGSISKMDDGFAEKINQYMQCNNQNLGSSAFNDSKDNRDLEMMLKTQNQSNMNAIRNDTSKENTLENSMSCQELIDADESFIKSLAQSSSRKQKRKMIKELLKHKGNNALRAKTKLLMSSYLSDEGSPFQNESRNREEDDLKFSQTKMDEIKEDVNEDQENEIFEKFMDKSPQQDKSLKNNMKDENVSSIPMESGTNLLHSNHHGTTTAATSRFQTAGRATYKDQNDDHKPNYNFPEIIEEEKSMSSHLDPENYSNDDEFTHQIPSPYYDQESVRQSQNNP